MNYLVYLKPNWKKIIFTVIITILLVLIMFNTRAILNIMCKPCPDIIYKCIDYTKYSIHPPVCYCGCYPLNKAISDDIKIILIPFIISYILYSFGEMIYHRPKK